MAQVNVGKVTLIPKGEYSAASTYARLDFVVHNGTSWVSLADGNTGNTPSAGSAYWQLLASAADEVTIISQEYSYAAQNAADFTGNPPTSGWQSSVPAVGSGNYLWTRIETTYSDGNTFDAYIPAKYGTNGSGAGTVTGLKLGGSGTPINPDGDGVVTLPLDSIPTEGSSNLVTSGGVLTRIYSAMVSPSATTPLMDGTASKGAETAYARGDHRHPSDSTKAVIKTVAEDEIDDISVSGFYTTADNRTLVHVQWGNTYAVQMTHIYSDTNQLYIRHKYGGTWSSWEKLNGVTLTGTLSSGQTSIILTAPFTIPNDAKVDFYTDKYGVNPTDVTVSGTNVTMTFESQTSNVGVKVVIS